ncbi:MAG: YggS family pyridoxal phosphate-dependent enzyme [Candidatus Neomarinimicrobiota bacterium]
MSQTDFQPGILSLDRLEQVNQRITAAQARGAHAAEHVTIVAVTKSFPVAALSSGYQAGHRIFGESRVQEAADKLPQFDNRDQCQARLIGHLQSNKTRKALELFDLIESVDSLKLLNRLDRQAGELGRHMPVYLQVNSGRDPAKSGFDPDDLDQHIASLAAVENLEIAGLMTIAPLTQDEQRLRDTFALTRRLQRMLAKDIPTCLDLSMGMSGDFEIAVEEGATHVRLGSVLYGPRPGT